MTYSLPDTHVIRADVLRAIRAFFDNRGFIEVVTPVRIPVPALELNIDPEPSGDWYLRTSPEFHMKRLVCAGHEKIYQIGSCFRQGERVVCTTRNSRCLSGIGQARIILI